MACFILVCLKLTRVNCFLSASARRRRGFLSGPAASQATPTTAKAWYGMGFGAAEGAMCSAGCVKFMGLATGTLLGRTSAALNLDDATVTAQTASVPGTSGAG